jgi:hypothetical protein
MITLSSLYNFISRRTRLIVSFHLAYGKFRVFYIKFENLNKYLCLGFHINFITSNIKLFFF